jgi:hypothetical protein
MRKNRILRMVFAIILFLLGQRTVAQNKTITGSVLDEKNTPIQGATVTVKNTRTGTSTDAKGEFTLSVPASAKALVISSVGFDSREVGLKDNTPI